jgi:hypothetical protein
VKYFVDAVTRVIYQPDVHSCVAHRKCPTERREEYDLQFNTVASVGALPYLLSYDGYCIAIIIT